MAESEIMEVKKQVAVLKEIVRIGTVSWVDPNKRTARVIFHDKDELPSGELKVLQNQPLITVENGLTAQSGTMMQSTPPLTAN